MSVALTYTVEIGDADPNGTRYDMTDRVRGLTAEVTAPIGEFGRSTARLQLVNTDGALTPNGGGTFGTLDWFRQGVFITADVAGPSATTPVDVFHGIVVDFDLTDDGVTSEVNLTCVDVLTVGGRSVSEFTAPTGSGIGDQASDWIALAYNGYGTTGVTFSGVDLPLLGEPDAEVVVDNLTRSPTGSFPPDTLYLASLNLSQPVLDWLNNTILPSGPNVAWPTIIQSGPNITRSRVSALNAHLVRSDTTRSDLTFAENATAGELPFRDLDREFTTDRMVNQAVVTNLESIEPAATSTVRNEESLAAYGVRSLQASALMVGTNLVAGTRPSFVTREAIGERYVNTRGDAEFVAQTVTVTDRMVSEVVGTSQSSSDAFAQLLDVSDAPWQIVALEYTPTGAASATVEHAVIVGRRIAATPGQTTVRLDLLPYRYTAAFILDDDLLGLLDTDRLG